MAAAHKFRDARGGRSQVSEAALFVLFLVILGIVLGFGYAFRSNDSTARALKRMRKKSVTFRRGFVPLLVGIALTSEASAMRWLADVSTENPLYVQLQATGLVLIILGIGMLTLVVLAKNGTHSS